MVPGAICFARKHEGVARALLSIAILLACAGCGMQPTVRQRNYLTYEYPFTDGAAGAAHKSAEKICAETSQFAVKSSSVCSLTRCTTSYECMDKADATLFLPQIDK
jgi:hypothetical protein